MRLRLALLEKKLNATRRCIEAEEEERKHREIMLLYFFYTQQNFYLNLRMRDFLSYEEMYRRQRRIGGHGIRGISACLSESASR